MGIFTKIKGLFLIPLYDGSLILKLDNVKVDLLDGVFDVVGPSEAWLHRKCLCSLVKII